MYQFYYWYWIKKPWDKKQEKNYSSKLFVTLYKCADCFASCFNSSLLYSFEWKLYEYLTWTAMSVVKMPLWCSAAKGSIPVEVTVWNFLESSRSSGKGPFGVLPFLPVWNPTLMLEEERPLFLSEDQRPTVLQMATQAVQGDHGWVGQRPDGTQMTHYSLGTSEISKKRCCSMWWSISLIQHSGGEAGLSLWVQEQLGLSNEFQGSQGYTERPHLKRNK